MSRTKLIIYSLHLILPVLLVTEIFLHQTEKKHTDTVLLNLDAQAAMQKSRIQDMITMYYQRVLTITSRRVLKNNLADFWEYGDVTQIIRIKKILPNVKQPFSDFKQIFVFDREGNPVTSTEESVRGIIPVNKRILLDGFQRPTVTFFEPTLNADVKTSSKRVGLLLLGPIHYKGSVIGGVGIVANNHTLADIAEGPRRFGSHWETRVAKKNDRGDAEIIVGGEKASNNRQAMANIPQHELDNPMTQALFRYEGVFKNVKDYSGHPVFAATRFIPEEEWGVVVKVDKEAVMAPMKELRRHVYGFWGLVFVFWLMAGLVWFK